MPNIDISSGFHDTALDDRWRFVTPRQSTQFTYTFEPFSHPLVGELIAKLNNESLAAMLDPTWLAGLATPDPQIDPIHDYFHVDYGPHDSRVVKVQSFRTEIDVSAHGAYAAYNWELLFHLPLTIAVHLSKSRRFAEAQRWFHFVFDPTSEDRDVAPPGRFWKFLAFRSEAMPTQIDELLRLLSRSPAELSVTEQSLRADILNGYRAILDKPFAPHAVARTRHLAYQYSVVMKYLDNLIAWGDDLFAQDTLESINEATQLYVFAANLLGTRPQRIPSRDMVKPKTFAQLKAAGLDPMGNALIELESQFPFNIGMVPVGGSDHESAAALSGIGRALYFCIPRNENLLGYWDTVAERLFKIRHCMNIAGVVRPLALFDPPIDPGMLVKAAAAGIDVNSAVSGLAKPPGPLRALPMIQRTLELCSEVGNLGNALLSVQEKGDAEQLARVRQRHEVQLQQMSQDTRFVQWKQAEEATEGLLRSRAGAVDRYNHYRRLLGLGESDLSTVIAADRRDITEDTFDEAYQELVGQYAQAVLQQNYPPLVAAPKTAADLIALTLQTGNLNLNLNEFLDLNVLGPAGLVLRALSSTVDTTAAALAALPDVGVDALPMGVGGHTMLAGGAKAADSGRSASNAIATLALMSEFAAGYAAKAASYQRRTDEWVLAHNQAANELMTIGRQILGTLIAEQVARREYDTVRQGATNAREIDQLLHDKFSNEDLYLWMQGETSRLYYQWYRFAFDVARRAEQTMRHELMRPDLDGQDFIKFNYWDGGRKGLLAGEALRLDVKRMEAAYHDNNKRELELTTHVSLRQLDPVALLALRSTGICTLSIPEWFFDRDCPGHYMRRIQGVAVSVPSVTGPFTGVNLTMSLLRSSVRTSPELVEGSYQRQGVADARFIDYLGPLQSIVTSTAVADSGLFDADAREERFLPFERAGTESTWKLELPTDYPAFDYATISDVILHLRYTARKGVNTAKVGEALRELFGQAAQDNLALLFSLRHDFPNEWHQFVTGSDDFSTTITRSHFPYFAQAKTVTITGLELYGTDVTRPRAVGDPTAATTEFADRQAFIVSVAPDPPGGAQVLPRSRDADVHLVVRYAL